MASNPNAGTQMFYTRKSDGLTYCFSPVPLIADTKEIIKVSKDGVNTQVGTVHTVTFNGTLLPNKPALSGVDPSATCLELLDRKHDQLCAALNEDYGNLLIVDSSGYPVLSVHPTIQSIDFPESRMVDKLDYTIVFQYEEGFEDDCRVRAFADTWQFQQNTDDTSAVTHSISADGINDPVTGSGAFDNARTFVLDRANTLNRSRYAFLSAPYIDSSLDLDNLFEYNHIRSETADVPGGRYEINETWVMSSGAFKDDRTIDVTYSPDEFGIMIPTTTVNGTVQGYGDTTAEKLQNAEDGFNSFVSPQIGFATSSGLAAKNRSDNRFSGTVNYSITYDSDRTVDIEERTISRQFQRNEDGSVTQTVTTSARVPITSSSGIQPAIDFCVANNYPVDNTIEPLFTASLSGNIESISSTKDDVTKAYSLVIAYRDQESSLWREEYSVERSQSVENARTQVSIQGTVQGLGAETSTKSTNRFVNASGAYYGIIEPLIRGRAETLISSGTCIGDAPVSQTLGYSILNGTISYSQTFDNRFLTDNQSIQSEDVEVTITLQGDVIAEIQIPGKADGPILQDQETVTGLQKSLRINYKMAPSGQDCGPISPLQQYNLEQEALNESNILVNNTMIQNSRGEKPIATKVFKVQDQYSFSRQNLDFSRNVTWKYTAS
jgi:hypothetical protein